MELLLLLLRMLQLLIGGDARIRAGMVGVSCVRSKKSSGPYIRCRCRNRRRRRWRFRDFYPSYPLANTPHSSIIQPHGFDQHHYGFFCCFSMVLYV